jgi:hypothetical protein
MNLDNLDPKEWLTLNAKLQAKKNALRKDLKDKGILKKGGTNDYDHYTYFSEAQYKELFTELFSKNSLELKFSELEYNTFEGSGKNCNGRMTRLEFTLIDVETGFFETTVITGEGMDKGDKAGYKAYTGAVKYYLADTFLVATGDDAEKESPSENMNTKTERKASPKQIELLLHYYTGENLEKLLQANHISKIEDLPMQTASNIISKIKK